MKTLDQIAIEQKADKGSADYTHAQGHKVTGHGYAQHYDLAFDRLRHSPVKLLEIGVGGGESIRTWLEYFDNPDTRVYGVDIVHTTNPYNTVIVVNADKPDPRYTFVTGDQGSEIFWQCFVADYGSDWDILVDDGGHANDQIITTFKMMWPHIKRGGCYAIEDLNCAYSGLPFFLKDGWPNHLDFIKDFLDQINRDQNDVESLSYSKELAILRKKA